jgi:hypothetical protein
MVFTRLETIAYSIGVAATLYGVSELKQSSVIEPNPNKEPAVTYVQPARTYSNSSAPFVLIPLGVLCAGLATMSEAIREQKQRDEKRKAALSDLI